MLESLVLPELTLSAPTLDLGDEEEPCVVVMVDPTEFAVVMT